MVLQNDYDGDIRVRRKAEALRAAGYRVDVLALRSSPQRPANYVMDGINVYTFSLGKKRGSKWRYLFEYATFFLWALYKQAMLMGVRKYDIIEVNTLPDFLVFSTLFPRWKGARVLLDMHEITPEFLMSKYEVGPNHWQVRLVRIIEKASFSYANHVITINEPIQQLLAGRGLARSKSTLILNTADEGMFAPLSDREHADDPSPASDEFVFMYHGTLTRIYGLDIALEAFSIAYKDMPGAKFYILGDGPEKRALETCSQELSLEDKVRFVGKVSPEEIPAWLARCDVGVLPTRQDVFLDFSFSNKLSEHIVTGNAVIASRLRTIKHYFSEDALAYFTPNTPADLAKQMVRLFGNKDLRTQLVEKAKQEYGPIRWAVMKQRYLALIADLAARPPSRT